MEINGTEVISDLTTIGNSGTGWSWDETADTLTLGNLFSGSYSNGHAISILCGSTDTINIVLAGNVSIDSSGASNLSGIYSYGNLTIDAGSHTLDIMASNYAIGADGDVAIIGGTVNARGDVGISSRGDVAISGGTLNVEGITYSIYCDNGSQASITGGTVVLGAGGIDGDVFGDLTVSGAGANVTVDGNLTNGGNLTVLDGTVNVTGNVTGNATVSGGTVTVGGTINGTTTHGGGTLIVGPQGGASPTTAPTITTTTLPGGTVGATYSQTLAATGTTPITWSINAGTLPAGLSLDASTGEISGTPTAEGTANFTVKATNSAGSNTKTFTVTINAAPAVDDSSPLPPHIVTPPGSDNNPVTNPDGSWTLSGGGTITIPGDAGGTTVNVPDGTIVAPDGSATIPSGGTARVTTPDGTIADVSGGSVITWPSGAIVVGPGGGVATYRDGTTEAIPPGAELTVDADGSLIISATSAAQNDGGCNAGAGVLSLLLAAAFAAMRRRALI
jgi:Synergist-CTERM protein sorting domain-containing protein